MKLLTQLYTILINFGCLLQVASTISNEMEVDSSVGNYTLRIARKSGKMKLLWIKGDDKHTIAVISFQHMHEIDANGHKIKAEGHSVNSFADIDFTVSQESPGLGYANGLVPYLTRAVVANVNGAVIKITVYIFKENGVIKVPSGETFHIAEGAIEFDVTIKDWKFCGHNGTVCSIHGAEVKASYLDLSVEIKGKNGNRGAQKARMYKNEKRKMQVKNKNETNGITQVFKKKNEERKKKKNKRKNKGKEMKKDKKDKEGSKGKKEKKGNTDDTKKAESENQTVGMLLDEDKINKTMKYEKRFNGKKKRRKKIFIKSQIFDVDTAVAVLASVYNKDGLWVNMTRNYPKLESKINKNLFTFRFEPASSIFYDPTVEENKGEFAEITQTSSSGTKSHSFKRFWSIVFGFSCTLLVQYILIP